MPDAEAILWMRRRTEKRKQRNAKRVIRAGIRGRLANNRHPQSSTSKVVDQFACVLVGLHEDSTLKSIFDRLKFFQQLCHHPPAVILVIHLKVHRVALFLGSIVSGFVFFPNARPAFGGISAFVEGCEYCGVTKHPIDHFENSWTGAKRFVELF